MTTKVAIIGAGGQIGRTLVARLAADAAFEPVAIVRNELTAAPLRVAGFDVRCGDIVDPSKTDTLLGDVDVVVNCAAAAAFWAQARREDRATVSAILRARRAARVIHFSSVAVYGTCIDSRRNTFDRPRPNHPYGKDKLDLEHFLARGARAVGKQLLTLRMGHVYGAEQWVSRFVFDRTREGWRLPFDGRMASNAVHVANVAAALRTLLGDQNAEGTYNVVDPGNSTWRQVFDWNASAVGMAPVPALDSTTSEQLRELYAAKARTPAPISIARELGSWARGLPVSMVAASPTLRDLALSTLSTLRIQELDQRLIKGFATDSLRRMPREAEVAAVHSWIFSDAAPGRMVEYQAEISQAHVEAVAKWHRGYSNPEALAPIDDESPRAVAVA